MRTILCLLAALLATQPASGQFLDPDSDWSARDTYLHAAAGASIDLAVRSGIVAQSWRSSAPRRVVLVVLIGAAYEGVETLAAWENNQLGQPGYGFGLKDLVADLAGAVIAEVAVAGVRALSR